MSLPHPGLRGVCRASILCVVVLAGLLPGSASAQSSGGPPPGAASASIRQLGTTPAYPFLDHFDGPPGARVRPKRELQKVTTTGGLAVANRILIEVNPAVTSAALASISQNAAQRGAGVATPVMELVGNRYVVDVTGSASPMAAAQAYKAADPRVLAASPDGIVASVEFTDDPLNAVQTNLSQIHVREAWDRAHGDFKRIAIVDTGIYEGHPDLAGKVDDRTETLWAFHTTDDLNGHGTHVAGIAGATPNNQEGVAGVGYHARLLNVKALDDFGDGSASSAASAIYWAVDHNATVINLSLAGTRDCNPWWIEQWLNVGVDYLRDALDYAWSHGVVVVAGAGNSGSNGKLYPAACPHVLSVANITSTNNRAPTSTYGDWVQVAARGESILSTALPGGTNCQLALQGQYAKCSGTSMAAPQVSGLVALVQESCAPISAQAVVDRITSTSDAIHAGEHLWQFGRVNAQKAVCLPPPTGLAVNGVTDTSLSFVWYDRSFGEHEFQFEWRPMGGGWQTVSLPANSTTHTASGLTAMQRYEFHVRACDFFGCSDWSATVTAMPNAFPLTIQRTGYGSVTSTPAGINCRPVGPSQCAAFFTYNTTVSLTPFPMVNPNTHDEYDFDHWEGACTGASYVCYVSMNQATSARVVFVKVGNSGP